MNNCYHFIFRFYDKKEFFKFLDSLENDDSSALASTIENIQLYGIQEAIKHRWVKRLEKNLYEIRSHSSSNNQQRAIYFKTEKGVYVISHGFVKKKEKTPLKEKKKGVDRRKKYF